jgi:hypothetical protein
MVIVIIPVIVDKILNNKTEVVSRVAMSAEVTSIVKSRVTEPRLGYVTIDKPNRFVKFIAKFSRQ